MFDSGLSVLVIGFWWIVASIAVSGVAAKRRHRFGTWMMVSLALSPLFAVLLLIAYPSREGD